MGIKLVTPKFIVAIIIFFIICLLGSGLDIQAKILTSDHMPDDRIRLKLIAIENETDTMEFQVFYNYDSSSAFVFPHSTFHYAPGKEIKLPALSIVTIKCSKGSYLPVFIQDGGFASGNVEPGYQGPFFISIWLQIPNAPEAHKIHIGYAVKEGQTGTIGVRIGKKGDYRLVAYDNVKFINQ